LARKHVFPVDSNFKLLQTQRAMKTTFSRIVATGGYTPGNIVKNDWFERIVPGADQWIFSRTGIRERRFAKTGQATSDLAAEAATVALRRGNIRAETLDCIVLATSTPDMSLPATACLVQEKIGAVNAYAFDMNAVCSGFIYALDVADALIRSGKKKKVLAIGADIYSRILDFTDPKTCTLFGDGASAAILEPSADRSGILASEIGSDGREWRLILVPSSGSAAPVTPDTIALHENTFRMDGRRVYEFAVRTVPALIDRVLAEAGVDKEGVDFVIPHQANSRMTEAIAKRSGMRDNKFIMNIERYGNTSAASVGLALHEAVSSGTIRPGNLVLLLGFGGGMTWGGMLVRM